LRNFGIYNHDKQSKSALFPKFALLKVDICAFRADWV